MNLKAAGPDIFGIRGEFAWNHVSTLAAPIDLDKESSTVVRLGGIRHIHLDAKQKRNRSMLSKLDRVAESN
jgi:hypothetical protein